MAKIKPAVASHRVERARSRVGMRTAYVLGKGGLDPKQATPGSQCDCSGFVAWCLELSRKPKPPRPFWIETTAMHKDATTQKSTFTQLEEPEPGCIVVYPDRFTTRHGKRVKLSEGHTGVVTVVRSKRDYDVIDCASGIFRTTGDAIHERSGAHFRSHDAIFICLKQDLE